MQAYILSVAGAVLLSAVVSLILPEGKLSPLIRGMTKLITLVLLVSPLISLLRREVFFLDGDTVAADEGFLLSCTQRVEENDEQAIAAWLEEEFGISALSEVQLETDGSYSAKAVTVRITDFGIYGEEEHIDISLRIEEKLETLFGCPVEVLS